jgi:hypothetical protein
MVQKQKANPNLSLGVAFDIRPIPDFRSAYHLADLLQLSNSMSVQFINNLSSATTTTTEPTQPHSHSHEPGAVHSHDHGVNEHGHTHEHLDNAGNALSSVVCIHCSDGENIYDPLLYVGKYSERDLPDYSGRNFEERGFTIGIGGCVPSLVSYYCDLISTQACWIW